MPSTMVFRCIICLEIFDHSLRSEEHVFPESLGGPWKIYDLCKPCNDRLGQNADAPLADDFWVKVARQRFKIEGKSGVPNPFDRIAIMERKHYGAPWQKTAARWEGNYLYRHPKRWPDGEMVYDARDAHKAAADAQKMRFRRPDAPPAKVRVTDPDRHSGVIEVPITSHPSLCMRGLLKIVYEFAYRLLGYSYLWDPNGRAIQRFLHSGETNHERLAVWHVFTSQGVLPFDGDHQAELIGGLARDGKRTIGYVRVFDRHDSVIEVSGRHWPSIDETGVAFVFDVEKKTERATNFRALGMNPWRLQTWMGHKRIDETMLYVHVAESHRREIPPAMLDAAASEVDPDRRVLAMLGARCITVASATAVNGVEEGTSVVS